MSPQPPRWEEEMADAPTQETTEEPQSNTPDDNATAAPPESSDSTLEDAGKKALTAERRARAAAEKQAKTLQDRLDAIEAANLSEQERAVKAAEDAKSEAVAAKAEAMRWRIAARHGINDEDAELFLTGTDEETLTRQAERFTALAPKPGKGNVVPGVGNQPPTPPSVDEQIRVAEADGDTQTAMLLKTQKLMGLAQK